MSIYGTRVVDDDIRSLVLHVEREDMAVKVPLLYGFAAGKTPMSCWVGTLVQFGIVWISI